MSTHRRISGKPRRSLVIAIVASMAAALAVSGTVLAADGGLSPQKQQFFSQAQSAHATAAALPRAPKPPNAGHAPTGPSSCPNPTKTGVFPAGQTPFHADAVLSNQAGAVSTAGDPYIIYAGAVGSDPQQGVLIVLASPRDPCAVRSGVATAGPSYLKTYPSPYRQGALTLTQVIGDTVAFTTATGGSGRFNFVAGQYL